jgi:HSP20 family protein
MSLIKWEPFEDFDRIFRDTGLMSPLKMQRMNVDLACDVYEDGKNLVAEMNVPGLKGDDIEVEVENHHLRISGKREEVKEKKEKNHYSKEIQRGSFQRVVPLPTLVEKEKVTAEYKDGVLKVVMPTLQGETDGRIKVKVS